MRKQDLHTGMIVETASGERFLVLCGKIRVWNEGETEICFVGNDGYITTCSYFNDLTVVGSGSCKKYDIMKVYRPRISSINTVLDDCDESNLIWERESDGNGIARNNVLRLVRKKEDE